jgi:hypothetical protein
LYDSDTPPSHPSVLSSLESGSAESSARMENKESMTCVEMCKEPGRGRVVTNDYSFLRSLSSRLWYHRSDKNRRADML